MTRNVELLQATMQQILDNPEQHDQMSFVDENACGTTACFAGWAALLSGWSVRQIRLANCMYSVGAKLLGLTDDEASILFYSSNSRAALELMVRDLVNGDELRSSYSYRTEVAES
jgi:hypothetical protein